MVEEPIGPNFARGRDVAGFGEEKEERGEATGTRGIPRRLEAETQRKREEVAPGDAMEDNVDQEVQMPGPLRPSKREIREKENYNAIGGMRNPI